VKLISILKEAGKVKYFVIVLCSISFLIPLMPDLLPWLTVVAIILFISQKNIFIKVKSLLTYKFILLFVSLYFFYFLGMFYSENADYGWKDLETKLSILIFPLLFVGLQSESNLHFKWILTSFICGCSLSAFIMILRASYYYFVFNQNVFFYENFSFYMHPSYLAIYFDFAILLLLIGGTGIMHLNLYQKISLVCLQSVTVILLSSKAGVLGLFLIFIGSFIFLAISRRKAKYMLLLFIIPGVIYIILNYFIDPNSNRFKISEQILVEKGLDKNSSESSTMRLLIWRTGINIIKLHPILGVGTGDVKDELMKAYQKNEFSAVLEKKLNAHNQFLQTTMAIGLIGFIVLILSLVAPLYRSFVFQNWKYALFLILVGFNFLFESMLERQTGVMFYAFFNALLFFEMENKNSKNQ
jgi:O-antigen ligase